MNGDTDPNLRDGPMLEEILGRKPPLWKLHSTIRRDADGSVHLVEMSFCPVDHEDGEPIEQEDGSTVFRVSGGVLSTVHEGPAVGE